MVAIAPEFTMGLVRPSGLSSTPARELKGRPVAFTPTLSRISSGPSSSQTRAKVNGLATLMIVNSSSASPVTYRSPEVPATQIPNRSAGTRARAGYTVETAPSSFDPKSSYAAVRSAWTRSAVGSRPVETKDSVVMTPRQHLTGRVSRMQVEVGEGRGERLPSDRGRGVHPRRESARQETTQTGEAE